MITDNELVLIRHIDTLTTAIEDVLAELDKGHLEYSDSAMRHACESAMTFVWETPGDARNAELYPLPQWKRDLDGDS